MKLNTKIIVLFVIYSVYTLQINNYFLRLQNSISRCTENIIHNTFSKGEYLTVSISSHDNSTFQENKFLIQMNLDIKWNLFTKKNVKNKAFYVHSKKSNGYIIQFLNYHELNNTLSFLLDSNWNPHAKFIIISNKFYSNEFITNVTKLLAYYKAINFVLLIPLNSNSTTLNIYTWFPYENQSCADIYNLTRIINRCTDGSFDKIENVFQEKIPTDLHQCEIRVFTVIWPPYIFPPRKYNPSENVTFKHGLEINLLNTIAQIANFKIMYMVSEEKQNWGHIAKGLATGIFKSLSEETAHVVISALSAMQTRFEMTDPSISYTFDQLIWCAPVANFRSMWHNIFDIFYYQTWITLALVYIITTLSIASLAKMEKNEIQAYDSISNCFLIMLAILTSVSIKRPKSFCIRILFICWCLFCLILSAIYITYLIYFLVTPRYDFQISSDDDIINSNISYGYLPQSKAYFKNATHQQFKNGIICNNADTCLTYVGIYKNFTFLAPKLFLKFKQTKFRNIIGESLYLFKDNYVSFPIQMYAVKGFPLIHRINDITARIIETGLMHKWEKNIQFFVEKSNNKFKNNTLTSEHIHTLELRHLKGLILIYSFGISFSIICFCAEMIYFKFRRIHFCK